MTTVYQQMKASVRKKEAFIDWSQFATLMPTGMDDASVKTRKKFFKVCDVNGNGMLSLAEFDRGLRTFIGASTLSEELFNAKPAIQRAFHAAKRSDNQDGTKRTNHAADGVRGLVHNDFVSRSEFRALLAYTRQYFELWQMFKAVDTTGGNYTRGNSISSLGASQGDRRISLAEFTQAVPLLERWGSTNERSEPLEITDAAAEFSSIDRDSSGFIRFDEFSSWALRRKLDLEDDDDPDGIEDLLTASAHELVTSADDVRRQERRETLEDVGHTNSTGFKGVYARRLLVDATPGGAPPEPLSVVKRRLLGPEGGAALPPAQRAELLRYLGQYNVQYRQRLLNDLQTRVKGPAELGAPGSPKLQRLGISHVVSRYDAERILSQLEEPRSFASLVTTPATSTAVPSLPPSLAASWASASYVSASAPPTARPHVSAASPRPPDATSRSPLHATVASRDSLLPTPETRMDRQRRVAESAHRALQRSQPPCGWGVRDGGNPQGRAMPHRWLMSDVMERHTKSSSTPRREGGSRAQTAEDEAPSSPRWQWSTKLPRAVRPHTVLVGELSRMQPLTITSSRLRYTPSARLGPSEDLSSMHFQSPNDKPPMRF